MPMPTQLFARRSHCFRRRLFVFPIDRVLCATAIDRRDITPTSNTQHGKKCLYHTSNSIVKTSNCSRLKREKFNIVFEQMSIYIRLFFQFYGLKIRNRFILLDVIYENNIKFSSNASSSMFKINLLLFEMHSDSSSLVRIDSERVRWRMKAILAVVKCRVKTE